MVMFAVGALTLLSTLATPAHAGAWVHDPGKVFAQVGYGWTVAANRFDETGTLQPSTSEVYVGEAMGPLFEASRFNGSEISGYAEIGLPAGFEVYGSLPGRFVSSRWRWSRGDNPDVVLRNSGMGDAMGGFRFGKKFGSQAVSLSAAVRGPLYDNHPEVLNTEAGNMDFYDDRVPLGEGVIDYEMIAAVGSGLSFGWAQIETGVRLRNRGYSTALPGRAQLGIRAGEPLAFMVETEWLATLSDGTAPSFYLDEYDRGPMVIDRAQYIKQGLGLMWQPAAASEGPFSGTGINTKAFFVPWGMRTSQAFTATAGIFWEN